MGANIAIQLITVGGTLGGAGLAALANTYLEHRRQYQTRELETLRLAAEHTKWLRDERLKAYAAFSLAGEEILQFVRSDMSALIEPGNINRLEDIQIRWRELRTELRKAYNQVLLFGGDQARSVSHHLWRTARDGGNDFLSEIDDRPRTSAAEAELTERIKTLTSRLGTAGERFLETCRRDLQQ